MAEHVPSTAQHRANMGPTYPQLAPTEAEHRIHDIWFYLLELCNYLTSMCGRSSQSDDNINQGKVVKNKESSFVSEKGRLCFLNFSSPAGPDQTKWPLCFYKGSPWFLFSSCWLQPNKGFLFLSCFVSTKGRPIIPSSESCNGNSALCVASVSLLHPAPFASLLEPAPTKQRAAFVSLLQPAGAEQKVALCLSGASWREETKETKVALCGNKGGFFVL